MFSRERYPGRGLPSLVVLYPFVSIKTCGVCQEEKESTTKSVGGFVRDLASVFLVKCACSKALGVQGGGFFGNVVWQRQNDSVREEGDGKGKRRMCLCVLGTPSLCVMIPIFHTLVVNAFVVRQRRISLLGSFGCQRCISVFHHRNVRRRVASAPSAQIRAPFRGVEQRLRTMIPWELK